MTTGRTAARREATRGIGIDGVKTLAEWHAVTRDHRVW